MELREAVQLLRDFLSPSNTKLDQKVNVNEVTLANLLQANIDTFKSKYQASYEQLCAEFDAETDVYWKMAQISLSLVDNLNNCRFEVNPNGCYLSITDETLMASYCQFITCFGIHYNLQDDVGVSIERLSKYGANIVKKRVDVDTETRNRRLEYCLTKLLAIKDKRREHFNFIEANLYRKHAHDLICALIQLCYSPQSPLAKSDSDSGKRDRLQKWLEIDLFETLDGSLLVSNLLMAQSSIKPGRLQQSESGQSKEIVWFVRVVGSLLTKSLLRPNSVMNVIRAVLSEINAVSASTSLASDWKKCDLVARILSQCPRQISIDEYIMFISPQILKLFFEYDPRFAKHFYRVAGSIYSLFASKWPELTRTHMTNQIVAPFDQPLDAAGFRMTETDLAALVDKVHLVYVASTEPNWQTLQQLPVQLVHLLFKVYLKASAKHRQANLSDKLSQTNDLILQILKLYVRMMPSPKDSSSQNSSAQFIADMIKCQRINDQECDQCISYEAIDVNHLDHSSEPVVVNLASISSKSDAAQIDKLVTKGLRSFLKELNDTDLNLSLLFCLFQRILDSYKHDKQQQPDLSHQLKKTSIESAKSDKTLLDIENQLVNRENNLVTKAIYYRQVASLFEALEPELILNESDKVLDFCQKTIEYIVDIIKSSTNDLVQGQLSEPGSKSSDSIIKDEYETIHMILSILSVFTTGLLKMDDKVKTKLQYFLPPLYELREIYKDSDLENLAASLYISIANLAGISLVATDFNKAKLDQNQNNLETVSTMEESASKKPLIEILDDDGDNDDEPVPIGAYQRALKDINDPLVPVKAHGLVELRRLVEKRDAQCCSELEKVTDIFMKHLKNEDSYVYLAAINGLIALTSTHFKDQQTSSTTSISILDTLIDHFTNKSNEKLSAENKLKIGESLTRTIRNYNDLVPKYAPKLLHMLLVGCRNEDELIRASSLSNMGETCKLLKYSLQTHIYEILNCLSSLIESDKSIQVKRSAIMVLKMILEGLKQENFLHVLGDSIAPLYRLLSKTKTVADQDDIIRLECQLALEYLNEFMKESLFPKQKLEKVIHI